jgi:hypothetical protein
LIFIDLIIDDLIRKGSIKIDITLWGMINIDLMNYDMIEDDIILKVLIIIDLIKIKYIR